MVLRTIIYTFCTVNSVDKIPEFCNFCENCAPLLKDTGESSILNCCLILRGVVMDLMYLKGQCQ